MSPRSTAACKRCTAGTTRLFQSLTIPCRSSRTSLRRALAMTPSSRRGNSSSVLDRFSLAWASSGSSTMPRAAACSWMPARLASRMSTVLGRMVVCVVSRWPASMSRVYQDTQPVAALPSTIAPMLAMRAVRSLSAIALLPEIRGSTVWVIDHWGKNLSPCRPWHELLSHCSIRMGKTEHAMIDHLDLLGEYR